MLAVHTFRYSPRAGHAGRRAATGASTTRRARRRSAEVRRAATATGRARRARARRVTPAVVWDRVERASPTASAPRTSRWSRPATRGIRVGALDTSIVEALDGDVLRARLVGR